MQAMKKAGHLPSRELRTESGAVGFSGGDMDLVRSSGIERTWALDGLPTAEFLN